MVASLGGHFVVNPTHAERKPSLLDLVVAGTKDAVTMVEAGAMELSEDKRTPLAVALLGMTASFFLERSLHGFHGHDESHPTGHHHHHPESHVVASRTLVLIGDGVHNFIDGVVIAAAFLADTSLGVATTVRSDPVPATTICSAGIRAGLEEST